MIYLILSYDSREKMTKNVSFEQFLDFKNYSFLAVVSALNSDGVIKIINSVC